MKIEKMNGKKFFGIGAVALMLLVAFAPAMNGMQLGTQASGTVDERFKLAVDDYDVAVVINDFCYVGFNENTDMVEYRLSYMVGWGPTGVDECYKMTLTSGSDGRKLLDNWMFCIGNTPGPSQRFETRTLFFDAHFGDEPSQESYVAGRKVVLEIETGDNWPENNHDTILTKWWKDSADYVPTGTEVIASAPHLYTTITNPEDPEIYIIDIVNSFDGRILPNILLSERMGWVGQLTKSILELSVYVGIIGGLSLLFLSQIKTELGIVGTWFKDVLEAFGWMLSGIWVPGTLLKLLGDFIEYVVPALESIITQGVIAFAEMAPWFYKFLSEVDATYNWFRSYPWLKQIKIFGIVDSVSPDEVVTVDCRFESKEYEDTDGDGSLSYEQYVSSEPLSQFKEKHQIGIHNCKVGVSGTAHTGKAESHPLLSYAFANGSIFWQFPQPGTHAKKKSILGTIGDILRNWLKDRPLFSLLEKILRGKVEQPEQQIGAKRDFDLDGLVQNALAEEADYEPYEDIVYKEYYKGAPYDPHIVYYGSTQVVIGFKSNVDVTKITKVEGFPVVDWLEEINVVIVEIYGMTPQEFIDIVMKRTDVDYAEENFVYHSYFTPNDEYWEYQWGPKAINCPQAWDLERGEMLYGDVAILDTGCNILHMDIPDTESYLDYNFAYDNKDVTDDCIPAHGTHCAGIICATMNNNRGIAGLAHIMPHYGKVLDAYGGGYGFVIAKAIVHMANSNGLVKVISMSLGGYGISTAMHVACDYAYYVKDVLVVAAAGNDGLTKVGFPARFNSVVSVGAVDSDLKLCSWSNHGPDMDLVAPGEDILSTTYNPNYYTMLSGTSMACPHVAGVASLYFSANPGASASNCKGKLFSTAKDLGSSGKDWEYGYGLVDAYNLVKEKSRPVAKNFQSMIAKLCPILLKLLEKLN